MTPDLAEKTKKPKPFHKYTLPGLQSLPDSEVAGWLNAQLAARNIHIENLYQVPRHQVVTDQLNAIGGHEVNAFSDSECHITHVKSGDVVSGPTHPAHERALLIALWREVQKPKKNKPKALADYTLDELLALPADSELDELLNERIYGSRGLNEWSRDSLGVGRLLKILALSCPGYALVHNKETGSVCLFFEKGHRVDSREISHAAALALLIVYWGELKIKENDNA